MHLSTHAPCIYPPMHHASTYPSTHTATHASIYPTTHAYKHPSTHLRRTREGDGVVRARDSCRSSALAQPFRWLPREDGRTQKWGTLLLHFQSPTHPSGLNSSNPPHFPVSMEPREEVGTTQRHSAVVLSSLGEHLSSSPALQPEVATDSLLFLLPPGAVPKSLQKGPVLICSSWAF